MCVILSILKMKCEYVKQVSPFYENPILIDINYITVFFKKC